MADIKINQMQNDLLFFSAVDYGYQIFIIPYIYFALKHNKNASFQFIIKGLSKQFKQNFQNFKQTFKIQNAIIYDHESKINANKLRFLVQPKTKSQYTYIGDVDIFINETVLPFHLNALKQNNTIYDNQIRLNSNRLTGLHFVKSNEWYSITKNAREYFLLYQNNLINDEQLLFYITKVSNVKMIHQANSPVEFSEKRPVHGLHLSLNRKPFTDKMEFPKQLFKKMFIDDFLKSEDFLKLKPFLSYKFFQILNICQEYVKQKLL